jgi:hypothetical protein
MDNRFMLSTIFSWANVLFLKPVQYTRSAWTPIPLESGTVILTKTLKIAVLRLFF